MKINIPEQHLEYFDMLVKAGVYKDIETTLSKAFERGLDETESDLEIIGGHDFEPDIDLSALQGKLTNVEVPEIPNHRKRLELVRKRFPVPQQAASIILLCGLFHHYYELKHSRPYRLDPQFRSKVRAMPHYPDEDMYDVDEEGEWYDEEDRILYSQYVDDGQELLLE